jgi:hypothetical protein
MITRFLLLAIGGAIAAVSPSVAHAGACEEGFVKQGNMISGLRFVASTTVADLPPSVAINQMRGIVARRGYDIIASEPAAGALLIEQPMTGKARAFPIEINATQQGGTGTVRMEAKLRAGVSAPSEGAKTEMCAALSELRGGREGRRLAAAGAGAVTAQAAPVVMSAQAFSQQISKDAERNSLAIAQRYTNKRFTLSGQLDYVRRDGNENRVAFKILQPHELAIRLPNMADTLWSVSCMMAPGTSVYVMQLKPGTNLRLTGTFRNYSEDRHVVWLEGCVQAQGR